MRRLGRTFLEKYDREPAKALMLGIICLFAAFCTNIFLLVGAVTIGGKYLALPVALTLLPTLMIFFCVVPLGLEYWVNRFGGLIFGIQKKAAFRNILETIVNLENRKKN